MRLIVAVKFIANMQYKFEDKKRHLRIFIKSAWIGLQLMKCIKKRIRRYGPTVRDRS